MAECCGDIEVVKSKIEYIEKDIDELKEKNEKENEHLRAISEAVVKMTALSEKMDERLEKTEQTQEKLKNNVDLIQFDLHKVLQQKNDTGDDKESGGKNIDIVKYLLISMLILIGFILGKADIIAGIWK